MSISIPEAYTVCREIARREAKNFYYSFVALPKHKSDAMCAVYAFMRKADDLSDDESISLSQRREAMAAWLAEWRAARAGKATNDPVFVALNDTQRRFGIADDLLEKLVRGTTLDIEEQKPGVTAIHIAGRHLEAYESLTDLYAYCYLVASVVGLVCIRIFGYSDPAAEKLAEDTGLAFQLTNILRDVKEDAERGRLYLPLETLAAHSIPVESVLAGDAERIKPVLKALANQARGFYAAVEQLTPMLDRDSRAAMWVLAGIYRRLLDKIEAANLDVFRQRVSVSTPVKLRILGQGIAMAGWNRMVAR